MNIIKIAGIMFIMSWIAAIAMVAWIFGCPKSYMKFVSKWQSKILEEIE